MKKFVEAVILGGLGLLIGAFMGLFIDGVLEQYAPGDNATSEEVTEYENSLTSLVIEFFLPLWFIGLLIGVVALIMSVADIM